MAVNAIAGAELPGAEFEIPAGWGEQQGGNLFHSFAEFNVPTDGSATFTASGLSEPGAAIENLIVRVTGETLRASGFPGSSVDGLLASTVNASRGIGVAENVFLLNPRGVMVGPKATLDLPGSLVISTADELWFADGSVFSAVRPEGSTLVSAPPEAFGFLSESPASIGVMGGLEVGEGATLALVGGDLSLSAVRVEIEPGRFGFVGGFLSAPEGHVLLVGVASSGSVSDVFAGPEAVSLQGFARLGNVGIVDGAIVSASGFSPTEEGFFDLEPAEFDDLGTFLTRAPGEVESGDVFLTDRPNTDRDLWFEPTGTLLVSGEDILDFGSGAITIRGEDLRVDDAEIRGITLSSDSGPIDIRLTGDLDLTGQITARAGLPFSGNPGQFVNLPGGAFIEGSFPGSGNAGPIRIEARKVLLGPGGLISNTTQTLGDGGRVTVHATERIDVTETTAGSGGIFSNAQGFLTGDAGDIEIRARLLRLSDAGRIINQTTGNGNAGTIDVSVARLEVHDVAQIDSSTSAQSLLEGRSGPSGLRGPAAVPDDYGPTAGRGGSIDVTASQSILLSGGADEVDFARLSTFSGERSEGPAGTIDVWTRELAIRNRAGVAVTTRGTGPGGDIDVRAANLVMTDQARIDARSEGPADAGRIDLSVSDSARLVRSAITTSASEADGGDIDIGVGNTLELVNSEITASVAGGTGGNVTIDPVFVILDESRIIARATTGAGGNIDITTRFLLATPGSLIDASSAFGVNGTVNVSSPDTDIAGSLTALPAAFVDTAALWRSRCAARSAEGDGPGRFAVSGKALSPAPDGYLTARVAWPAGPSARIVSLDRCGGGSF